MRRVLPIKFVSKKVILGLVIIDLILLLFIFKVVSSSLTTDDQLAYLSVISGDVKVSDGITEIAAKNGDLIARNLRTLVKTGQGIASIKLPDGSLIILDTGSTVEFNRKNEGDPTKFFALNLVKGRLLVINENDGQAPTQLLVGGNIAVRVANAMMGLEVNTDGEVFKRVDCLVGQCIVNGYDSLLSGHNAQIKPGGDVLITDGVAYETWMKLGKISLQNPTLIAVFANIFPSITPTTVPTIMTNISSIATSTKSRPTFTFTPKITFTPAPSSKFTLGPTESPTSTITKTFIPPTPIPPTTVPAIPPTSMPPTNIPPTPTEQLPVVIESCGIDPSTVPGGNSIALTFYVHFSAYSLGYGFEAMVDSTYGQSGCSGMDNDGDGMAYCTGSSGNLPASTTVNVMFKSSVGDCAASYSSP